MNGKKKKPGRPEENLVIDDAGGALDALLGKGGTTPCEVCRTANNARGMTDMEMVREDGRWRDGKASAEFSIWRCKECGTQWRRSKDSGPYGSEVVWFRVE